MLADDSRAGGGGGGGGGFWAVMVDSFASCSLSASPGTHIRSEALAQDRPLSPGAYLMVCRYSVQPVCQPAARSLQRASDDDSDSDAAIEEKAAIFVHGRDPQGWARPHDQ